MFLVDLLLVGYGSLRSTRERQAAKADRDYAKREEMLALAWREREIAVRREQRRRDNGLEPRHIDTLKEIANRSHPPARRQGVPGTPRTRSGSVINTQRRPR
jgi:hypothetical protein